MDEPASGTKVRFSLMLPTFWDAGEAQPYRRTIEFAQLADRLGYFMGTFGHHSFTPEISDPAAPFALLSAVAAHTDKLRLGTGIYLAALHHPVTVAEQVATLDQISGGRAVLGVGLGYRPYEYEGFGLEFGDRAERLEELLTVIRDGWRAGYFEFSGRHYQVAKAAVHPTCVQRPHVPVLVGGSAPAAIDRAARLGDGWFALPQESLVVMQGQVAAYRAACRAYGKTPYVCMMRNAWVAPSMDQVQREWLPRMVEFHKTFADARASTDDPVIERLLADQPFTLDEYLQARAIAGTPEVCAREIEHWIDAIAPDEFSLIFGGSDDQVRLAAAIEQFATEVMPAFA